MSEESTQPNTNKSAEQPTDSTPKLSRRSLLQAAGAALLSTAAPKFAQAKLHSAQQPTEVTPAQLRSRPNILLIITDQERYPRHWPSGWSATNLPNRERLAANGLTFTNAICNSCMCSPSRSTLFTGLYPAQHGVVYTLTSGGSISDAEPQLPKRIQNMAHLLASAGYNVQYRGKWHLSKGSDGGKPSVDDVISYGFNGWIAPDAGENVEPESFGYGEADHDTRYAQEAVDFLSTQTPEATAQQPFALIVSFVNPHDVLAYPKTIDDDEVYAAIGDVKYNQGISLDDIPSLHENLLTNNKPTAQVQSVAYLAAGLGALPSVEDRRKYVNLYAYLHTITDKYIGDILDTLIQQDLFESTVVIRTSDHGEMGLSHGGLRQKLFNAYQETINVPLVISNPVLFPSAQTTDSLASLVDVMPTLATLAEVPSRDKWEFKGVDLTPVIYDPAQDVQEAVLFTFDDENAGTAEPQTIVDQPNHIRAVTDGEWKFARYFDPTATAEPQYELYDLVNDPAELNNLADDPAYQSKRAEMAEKLAALEEERLTPMRYSTYFPAIQQS